MNTKTALIMWWKKFTAIGKKKTDKRLFGSLTKEQLMASETINGTPFRINYEKEVGFYITMGDYRLTEPTETWQDQLFKIEDNDWKLHFSVTSAVVEQVLKRKVEIEAEGAKEELTKTINNETIVDSIGNYGGTKNEG